MSERRVAHPELDQLFAAEEATRAGVHAAQEAARAARERTLREEADRAATEREQREGALEEELAALEARTQAMLHDRVALRERQRAERRARAQAKKAEAVELMRALLGAHLGDPR